MKPNIHPQYKSVAVVCQCGNKFDTRSTSDSLHVEVPYFTGKQRLMDTAGRVDRFRRKYAGTAEAPKA